MDPWEATIPGTPQPTEDQPAPEDFKGGTAATVWTVIFVGLMALLALSYLYVLYIGIDALADPDGETAQSLEQGAAGLTAGDLWTETSLNLFLMGGIPVAWLLLTRVKPLEGMRRYLRLDGNPQPMLKGFGIGILMVLAIFVIGALELYIRGDLDSFTDTNSSGSPVTDALFRVVTWPLAFWIAFTAAVGEEILFRGFLQKKIGWIGQAVVFGLAHAGYATVAQILIPFAIGLLFGWFMKRGSTLWLVIGAHFSYNFVQLALAISWS